PNTGPSAPASEPTTDAKLGDPAKPPPPAADEPLAITGRVVDETGTGAAGAEVRFTRSGPGAPTAVTDRDGAFRLPLPGGPDAALRTKQAVIAADRDGRRQGMVHVDTLKDPRDVRVTLRPARAATVRVADAAKRPVAGARVVLMSAGLEPLTTAATADD